VKDKLELDEYVEFATRKVRDLDPDDCVRRGILETLADLFLHPKSKHDRKRVERRMERIGY
jgi:hypothetical protein